MKSSLIQLFNLLYRMNIIEIYFHLLAFELMQYFHFLLIK